PRDHNPRRVCRPRRARPGAPGGPDLRGGGARVVFGNAAPRAGVSQGMRLTSAGFSILFAAGSLAGCTVTVDSQSQIVREEKRFTVQGTADVRVTTFDGAINVQSWDKPDVLIEVEKRGPTRESIDALEIT